MTGPGHVSRRRAALWRALASAGLLVVGAVAVGVILAPGAPASRRTRAAVGATDATPAPATAAAASLPAPARGFAIPRARLLDAHAVTRWAPVLRATAARLRPSFSSRAVATVGVATPEGTTNLVDASGETRRGGVTWVRARIAALPNGTAGWLPRRALGGWTFVSTRLVVNRAALTATLYRDGHAVFHARVGVGAPATPTPAGSFYVRDRLTKYASPEYGPVAFGTSARSPYVTDWPAGGFIGIHGTDRPGLVPGRISHGCIRLRNAAVLALARLMPVGTPVIIR